MAQMTGKDAAVLIGGRDVSGDGNNFSVSWSAEAPENTGFGDSTRTRLAGIKDWTLDISGFFNDNTGQWEALLQALLAASDTIGVYPGGATACKVGFEGTPLGSEYSVDTPVDGMVTLAGTFTGSGPLYDVWCLTACTSGCTDLSASSLGAGVDTGCTATDCKGFLRCTSSSGTSETLDVVIQHSSDDSSYADIIAFAQVTAGSTDQIVAASTATILRYLRSVYTIQPDDGDFTWIVSAT